MKLKICGNRDPENIRALLAIEPDYLGFIFYPYSKRYVGTDPDVRTFISALNGVQKVGVFVNMAPEKVCSLAAAYRLDLLQLHGAESPLYCRQIARQLPVIKAFGIAPGFDFNTLEAYQASCSHFLFDTADPGFGGSGRSFDWSVLDEYRGNTPFFLGGGIGSEHVPAIRTLQQGHLAGIDVNSRFELSPGVKDISSLKQFNHELRN